MLMLGELYRYVGDDIHYFNKSCKVVDLFEYGINPSYDAFVNVEFKDEMKW